MYNQEDDKPPDRRWMANLITKSATVLHERKPAKPVKL
ncbi:Protein of unknown function [Pyronema omphalodes CBS 100304]|uniref:Uncharacterized protein n=1 Tax=Pyronema omphalodes (strain CBS 100304) TaxID=1076935 RepID=U4L3R8_PYROM|nr:Protein of unknown function [Pyronema omphalodes CBS 100304]